LIQIKSVRGPTFECSLHRNRGALNGAAPIWGNIMDDRSLRQNIIDELDWEPGLDAAHIGVAVDDGVVTLTGHVPSYAQRVAAEAAVKRVKGVRAIAQDVEVRFSGPAPESDEDIASRAVSLLRWSVLLPGEAIQARVSNGWITLDGEVEWQYQRRAAEDAVRGLIGVKGVSNLITVKPTAVAADVARSIEEALRRDARLEADRVKVTVDRGKVRLEGRVRSWHERDAVERAAWAAPGVKAVEDHIVIG
jgi:osmotically-inducible protein OsmY